MKCLPKIFKLSVRTPIILKGFGGRKLTLLDPIHEIPGSLAF